MSIVPEVPAMHKPSVLTVSYARLYGSLDGHAVQTPAGLVFVDHDQHLYALPPEHAAACGLLQPVGGVERSNVLAARARAGEV